MSHKINTYQDLKMIAKRAGLSLKDIATGIGLTPNGLRYAMHPDNISRKTINKVMKYISENADEEDLSRAMNSPQSYTTDHVSELNAKIDKLEEQLVYYKKLIDFMEEQLKEKDNQNKK